jgi:hypothetical protein
VSGPLLVSVNVNITVSPTFGVGLFTAFVTPTSEPGAPGVIQSSRA